MLLTTRRRGGPPWLTGFRSYKDYEAYAEQQERRRRRQEDRERWAFDRLLTEEELAQAKERVERRWICAVEGHDWKRVDTTGDDYEVLQCYRCDNLRFVVRDVSAKAKDGDIEHRRQDRIGR